MKMIIYSAISIIGLIILIVAGLEMCSTYTASASINQHAPVKTYQQITIGAAPQKVYQVMSDIDHWAQWHHEVREPRLNGPFEKGSSFDWKSSGLNIHSTLHTAIPGQSIGWSGKAFGAFAIHNWTFIGENGHTTVKVEESMEGWLVKLMRGKFQKGLEQSLQVWLQNLKARAEQ